MIVSAAARTGTSPALLGAPQRQDQQQQRRQQRPDRPCRGRAVAARLCRLRVQASRASPCSASTQRQQRPGTGTGTPRGDADGSAAAPAEVDVPAACGTHWGLAALVLALGWCAAAGPVAAAADGLPHHAGSSLADLAEGEEFWGNVAKYARYFVTVMLGTGYVMVQPLLAAFKRPVTAAVAVAAVVGGFLLVRLTLSAMLGLQEPFDYQPGSIVPYS